MKILTLAMCLLATQPSQAVTLNKDYWNSFAEGFQNSTCEYIEYEFDSETHLIPQKFNYKAYTYDTNIYSYTSTLCIKAFPVYQHMLTELLNSNYYENAQNWYVYATDTLSIDIFYVISYDNDNNEWRGFNTSYDTIADEEVKVCSTYAELVSQGGENYISGRHYFLLNENYGNYTNVRDNAYAEGYRIGRQTGYSDGYSTGKSEGELNNNGVANVFTWFRNAFSTMTSWLDYDVLPGVNIGLLVSLPLVVGLIMFLINFFKGEG